MHPPPKWVSWGVIAPTLLTTLGILAWFGIDWEDVTPATVQFVTEEDDKVEENIKGELSGIQTSVNIVVGNDAADAIMGLYRTRCAGRASTDIHELLAEKFEQYESARKRKHNFETKPFLEVCAILGITTP